VCACLRVAKRPPLGGRLRFRTCAGGDPRHAAAKIPRQAAAL